MHTNSHKTRHAKFRRMQIDTLHMGKKCSCCSVVVFCLCPIDAYGFFTVRKFKLALCCFRHKCRTIISWRISFHLFSCTVCTYTHTHSAAPHTDRTTKHAHAHAHTPQLSSSVWCVVCYFISSSIASSSTQNWLKWRRPNERMNKRRRDRNTICTY